MMNERDDGLDGARGIAAMAVVLSHVAAMTWVPFVDGAGNGSTLERVLWHLGAPAVDLVLVLSGYVVTRSLLRRPVDYFPYLLGRLVRLLPVAWIAIGLGLALRSAGLHAPSGTSSGLLELASPLTSADVIGLMTLVAPVPNVDVISPPLWTLVLEMQAAYAMPLLASCSARPVPHGEPQAGRRHDLAEPDLGLRSAQGPVDGQPHPHLRDLVGPVRHGDVPCVLEFAESPRQGGVGRLRDERDVIEDHDDLDCVPRRRSDGDHAFAITCRNSTRIATFM